MGLVRSALVAVVVVELLDQVGGREDDDDGRAVALLVAGDEDGLRLGEARAAEVAGSSLDDGVHIDRVVLTLGCVTELALLHQSGDGQSVLDVGELEADPGTLGISAQLDHGGHEQPRFPAAGAEGVEAAGEVAELDVELDGCEGHLLRAGVNLREVAFDRDRRDSGSEGHAYSR